MTAPMAWQVRDSGSWGVAVTDTPADMAAALALTGSWPITRRQAYVRRDQWGNLATSPPGPPALTSIAPNTGPVAGGTTSLISGANLTGTSAVYYGGSLAASFTVVSNSSITATSPPKADGNPGNVNVNVLRGVGSNPVQFDYQ